MKLKDVFLYLYNSGSANVQSTNITKDSITVESDSTIQLELSKIPYSKEHVFIFVNGEYKEFDYSLDQNRINLPDISIPENFRFSQGDLVNVFYFSKLSNNNIPITPSLDVDEFIGGDLYYILKVGALDSNYVLVSKNGKVQHDYTITNGVLEIPNTIPTDKIYVFYLNRGYLERRSKISLKQLDTATIDTRYFVNNNTYDKSEVDSLISSLNQNSPLGLSELSSLTTAINEHSDFHGYLTEQLSMKSDIGHLHHNLYYTRFETINDLYDYIEQANVMSNTDVVNNLDTKINKNEVYNRDELDLIISTLPGNNSTNRGVFVAGGANRETADTNVMDIINISTQSNALFFGTFQTNRRGLTGMSNGLNNIGIISGGDTVTNNTGTTSIFSMNILNATSVSYFGDLIRPRFYATSESNGTNNIGVILSGNNNTRDIEYILIGANYTSGGLFGQLSNEAKDTTSAAVSSGRNDRIVFAPVVQSASIYISEYITPSTLSNSVMFGQVEPEIQQVVGTSNDMNDRGIFAGGRRMNSSAFTNVISYINIANISNSIGFGVLNIPRARATAVSNGTNNRGVFGGGNTGLDIVNYLYTNDLEYININSSSNAMNFGDLTLSRGDGCAGLSNSAL
jgi:hypothetical protein